MPWHKDQHLENLVAVSLLKDLWYLEDTKGFSTSLNYLRTKDGKEIDFVTSIDRKIHHLIEVKTSDDAYHKDFDHFRKFIKPQDSFLIVKKLKQKKFISDVHIKSAEDYLLSLNC